MQERIYSFPPLVDGRSRILIVGSMPSVGSLEAGQYYGSKVNIMWPMLFDVFGVSFIDEYEGRKAFLFENGLAMWDAAYSCHRQGSLDSNMKNIELNDFLGLFESHPSIERVLCNGGTAYRLYQKAIKGGGGIEGIQMPSTSPAAARLRPHEKAEIWRPQLFL